MVIAVLGWGSLIWDKQGLPLKTGWKMGGPVLPIEFSRVSTSRKRALTLVIDPANGVSVPTRFAVSSRDRLEDALNDLRIRERTAKDRIGYVDLPSRSERSNVFPEMADIIRTWAAQKKFDAVIWTDLSSNFQDFTGTDFSVAEALRYLYNMKAIAIDEARDYIFRAPAEVDTRLRRSLYSDPWMSLSIWEIIVFKIRTLVCKALQWLTSRR